MPKSKKVTPSPDTRETSDALPSTQAPTNVPPSPVPKMIVENLPGFPPYFYSNVIQVTWTVFDVKLRFLETIKVSENRDSTMTERAVVTLAWAEAKFLAKMLEDTVGRFEKLNGEIKTLPDLKLP